MSPNIVSIVGKSNSGKTTLLEKLIPELTAMGYAIGTVKHAHDGFEMDTEGKDSWRHRNAGAKATLVISDGKIALIKNESSEAVTAMKTYLSDMDLIMVEGFKRQALPKIEIFRVNSSHSHPFCMEDPFLVAFVSDSDHRPDVPVFGLEDIKELARFIVQQFIQS
jgi:molybdopterin-guanine dinucleotide biosynthesis protein B